MTEKQISEMMKAFVKVRFDENSDDLIGNGIPMDGLEGILPVILIGGSRQNMDDFFSSVKGLDPDADAEMIEQMIDYFGRRSAGINALSAEVLANGRIMFLSSERLLLLYYSLAAFSLSLSQHRYRWMIEKNDEERRKTLLEAADRQLDLQHLFEVRYAQMESFYADYARR